MYLPAHFAQTVPGALAGFMARHPFGTLVTAGDGGLDAEHLPFFLDADPAWLAGDGRAAAGTLCAHVARANPVCARAARGCDALVVFRGDHGYVSPNAYPAKQRTHRAVPTWNYEVMHAHGRLSLVEDERALRGLLARLTRIHEARAGESPPWRMGEAPRDYLDAMLQAVGVIEVAVTRVEGKSKLGQNRSEEDRLGAAAMVERSGHAELGAAMRAAGAGGNADEQRRAPVVGLRGTEGES